MPKSQQSWVLFQHPPTQWNVRAADEAVLNKIQKKIKNPPIGTIFICISHDYMYDSYLCSYLQNMDVSEENNKLLI